MSSRPSSPHGTSPVTVSPGVDDTSSSTTWSNTPRSTVGLRADSRSPGGSREGRRDPMDGGPVGSWSGPARRPGALADADCPRTVRKRRAGPNAPIGPDTTLIRFSPSCIYPVVPSPETVPHACHRPLCRRRRSQTSRHRPAPHVRDPRGDGAHRGRHGRRCPANSRRGSGRLRRNRVRPPGRDRDGRCERRPQTPSRRGVRPLHRDAVRRGGHHRRGGGHRGGRTAGPSGERVGARHARR